VSDERKESIWKREISFGRKADGASASSSDAPKHGVDAELEEIKAAAIAAVTPTAPAPEPVRRPAKPLPAEPEETAELPVSIEPEVKPVPFWKKEIGGSKKPKQPKEPKAPRVQKEKVATESVPFWKKEIGGSKKPKQPKAPKVQKEKVATESVPFWKKEIGGSKKPKEPKEPKAPKVQKEKVATESVPFWKRELAFGTKKPSVAKAKNATKGKEQKEAKEKPERQGARLKMPRLERPARAKRGNAVPKRLVGLKIGASQLAAARVANNGSAELLQVAREALEPGIIVGGELREPELLADALREFFRVNKLPKRNVRLGIANNRIGVRSFEISGIENPKQLENAIRFRAQEALPIPIEEAVLDYQILSETTNDEGETVKKVLLVVAYRELVDRYVSACRKAGVELVGIDLEAFALLRSMGAPREEGLPADAALVVVSVGHERSTFAVSDGRVCEFTRVLEWGGSSLNLAIARALDTVPSDADSIKRVLNLNVTTAPEGMAQEKYTTAREAVLKQVGSFARELVSSLQFYQNQEGSLGIAEIVVTGGTAHLPGLSEELQRLIGVPVRVGDPLMRVRVGKNAVQDEEQLGSLAIAIGLGIED
jgi:type IV pilus assembly protein PilM